MVQLHLLVVQSQREAYGAPKMESPANPDNSKQGKSQTDTVVSLYKLRNRQACFNFQNMLSFEKTIYQYYIVCYILRYMHKANLFTILKCLRHKTYPIHIFVLKGISSVIIFVLFDYTIIFYSWRILKMSMVNQNEAGIHQNNQRHLDLMNQTVCSSKSSNSEIFT